MAFDVKKLGLDRFSTGMSRAGNRGTTRVVTGDITKGELVRHQTSSSAEETINIRARTTAAFPVTIYYTNGGTGNNIIWKHEPEKNRILVRTGSATPCDFTFWVW